MSETVLIITGHFIQKMLLVQGSEEWMDTTPYPMPNQTTGYRGQIQVNINILYFLLLREILIINVCFIM